MIPRYLDFIRDTVYRSLPQAKLGGRPGTYQLVRSFLNIRQIGRNPALVDGFVEGQPIWAMVFYCLRCGDMEDALNAVTKAGYVGVRTVGGAGRRAVGIQRTLNAVTKAGYVGVRTVGGAGGRAVEIQRTLNAVTKAGYVGVRTVGGAGGRAVEIQRTLNAVTKAGYGGVRTVGGAGGRAVEIQRTLNAVTKAG